MFEVRRGVIFYIRLTDDGYDVYRSYDNKSLELIECGLATLKEVNELIDEEV